MSEHLVYSWYQNVGDSYSTLCLALGIFDSILCHDQSSRLNNDATYGMSREYMTFSNIYIVCRVNTWLCQISLTQSFKINIYFLICDSAPTRGMIFDKHDKSRRYLTSMTDDRTWATLSYTWHRSILLWQQFHFYPFSSNHFTKRMIPYLKSLHFLAMLW